MATKPLKANGSDFKVTPEDYNEFIAQVDLDWVYLESSTIKRYRMPGLQSEAELTYEEKLGRRRFESTDSGFRVLFNYQIKFMEVGEEKPFGEIKCTYAAEYDSKIAMNDDIFSVFRELNLPLNIWPYVREFVHGTTNRMGLPTLILRSLKR